MFSIMRKNTPLPVRLVASFAVVAGLIALVVTLTVARDDDQPLATANAGQSSALWIPSPTTLQDLVDVSDAIVVGEIVGLMKQTIEGPFDDSGDTDNRDDVPPPRQYPYSYFGIRISDTLLNDGFVVDNPVLRLKGHAGDGIDSNRRIPLPQAGESFVLFLSRNPDNESYGVYGPWAILNTDGSTVTAYGAELAEPQFARGATPAQLKLDVAETVGSRVEKNPMDLLFPTIIIQSPAESIPASTPTPKPQPTVDMGVPPADPVETGNAYDFKFGTLHCGVENIAFGGQYWRAENVPEEWKYNPPAGWNETDTTGRIELLTEDIAVFTSQSGNEIRYVRRPEGELAPCY